MNIFSALKGFYFKKETKKFWVIGSPRFVSVFLRQEPPEGEFFKLGESFPPGKWHVLAKMLGYKTVRFWLGTDVLMLENRIYRLWWKFFSLFVDYHYTTAPWLIEELKRHGMQAKFYGLYPHFKPLERKKHDEFTVLTLLRSKKRDFYGGKIVDALRKEFSQFKWIILDERISHQEILKLYSETDVLLRMSKHDSMSLMVQEALMSGCEVIWSQKFPKCHHAETFEQAKEILGKLANVKGIKNVQENSFR